MVALCFVVGTVRGAQLPASVSALRVNRTTMEAAELRDAVHFVAALAIEKVPAGFVFAADEGRASGSRKRSQDDGPAVPVQSAVDRFLARHPNYAVARSDWGLVIEPRSATVCVAALRTVVTDGGIGDPAYVAFWKLARLVNPTDTPTAPPGVVCGGGGCNSGVPQAHRARVALTFNDTSLQEALSQLVSQAPGLVWTLREERRGRDEPIQVPEVSCQLGYFDGDLYVQTSYVFGKTPAGGRR